MHQEGFYPFKKSLKLKFVVLEVLHCQIQSFRLHHVYKKIKVSGPMSNVHFKVRFRNYSTSVCKVTFECKERKLRGPNCALCGGSAATAT